MRKQILLIGLLGLLPLLVYSNPAPNIGENSILPDGAGGIPLQPWSPTDDYVGTVYQAGTTWYDYQHNGSTSRQIGLDGLGNVHIVWMNGLNSGASNRHIFYNFFQAGSFVSTTGYQVSTYRSGYCMMDLTASNIPGIFYHATVDSSRGVYGWTNTYGGSTFTNTVLSQPPDFRGTTWPHGVIDHQGKVHMAMQTNPNTMMYYAVSANGGVSFTTPATIASTTGMAAISQTMAASPVDNKLALVYTHPLTTGWQDEDVFYFESDANGVFNFANPAVNITNYAAGGTVRAWASCNAIYDEFGELHIAWSTLPYPATTPIGASVIWHWSEASGITKIVGELAFDNVLAYNDPGAWHLSWDLPTLGYDADGVLYCTWEQCTAPGDSSAAGFGNFDVYVTYSEDNGATWMAPVNVTDTHTPLAPAGQCMSEGWPTMAKSVDDYLHIFYIQDKDAGGIVQSEGSWTLNPVIYQKVPVADIQTEMAVTAVPVGGPIIIPPGGGTFSYTLTIANNSGNAVVFDGYVETILPTGTTYPILQRNHLTLPGGGSIPRTMNQTIPAGAPAGTYTYRVAVGDWGWNEWAFAEFTFIKEAVDGGNASGGSWNLSGWDSEDITANSAMPTEHALVKASPNPFNPVTEISYTIPQTGDIKLSVYDISGREAATLYSGYQLAGSYSVKFEAGNLASGVYFVTLNTGKEMVTVKTLLLK